MTPPIVFFSLVFAKPTRAFDKDDGESSLFDRSSSFVPENLPNAESMLASMRPGRPTFPIRHLTKAGPQGPQATPPPANLLHRNRASNPYDTYMFRAHRMPHAHVQLPFPACLEKVQRVFSSAILSYPSTREMKKTAR